MIDLESLREQGSISAVGIGLRTPHYQAVLAQRPDIPWLEVMVDNYMVPGGQPHYFLRSIRDLYPITFHGVGMSLGSAEPLDNSYLQRLKELMSIYQPAWISDHLCWSQIDGHYSNDLLPLPYTEEAVDWLCQRIEQVQEFIGQALVIENVSSYLQFSHSSMTEWEFIQTISNRTGCGILLDINNIYVSSINHGFSPLEYLYAINPESVVEIHLAGYEDQGTHLLDTHGEAVHEPVWDLYQRAIERMGKIPTLIEWDSNIPELPVLMAEAEKASTILFSAGERCAVA